MNVVETATTSVDYVDVQDSNATGETIVATNSFGEAANNTNWDIDGGECVVQVYITATEYHNLELYPPTNVTYILGTDSGQNITTTGYAEIGDGTVDGIVTAATNNPTFEIGTNFILSANASFRASVSALFSIAGNWTNSGTFAHNNGTVTFIDNTKTSVISGATTFYNFTSTAAGKTLQFAAGVIQTFAGTFTVTGADGNLINIHSDTGASQWLPYFENPQGSHESPTVTYAHIQDSGGESGSEAVYLDATSEEGTNVNTNYWIWPVVVDDVTISGTVYTDEGSTASTEGSIIHLAIDGSSIATTTASTTNGFYEFTGITTPTTSDPITVFIDDNGESGATITRYQGNDENVENLDIYVNRVIVRHEDGGPISNADIGHYTTDTPYTVSTGDLSLSSGHKLLVWENKTFTPGGDVTTPISADSALPGGDLEIQSGATLNMEANSLSVGGSYLNSGTFSRSVGQTTTFTATASGHTIVDGGNNFYDIVFNGTGGGWLYKDGASDAPNQTTMQDGTATFLNAKTGSVTVNGGTLLVDWYLGIHVVAKDDTDYNINTGAEEIDISENSATPASTIFRHDGASWGTASSTQSTETDGTGINPQPESDGAIRIREYQRTSSATTTYLYSLQIAAQTGFAFYDFYQNHGESYLSSSLSATGTQTISDNWWRSDPSTVNGTKPYSGLNESPAEGTWYAGLASDLQFSVDDFSADLGFLNEGNTWTATGTTILTATTSFSGGYTVKAYANNDGRLKLGGEEEYIIRWPHDNQSPAEWNNACEDLEEECGFGHTTDDTTLGAECNNNRFAGGTKYAGFATSSAAAAEVARSCVAVSGGESSTITYRVSAPRISVPGIYSGTVFYIASVNY